MNLSDTFAAMENGFDEQPRFLVEPPDGRTHLAELPRQTSLFGLMRIAGPSVEMRALPNAGKRNPAQARKEGIRAGLFDVGVWWNRGHAVLEMKGYSGGRPGKLSSAQIEFGNRLFDMGHHVACFFTPETAVQWLALIGAPVRPLR